MTDLSSRASRAAANALPATPEHPYQQIERQRVEHLVLGRARPPARSQGRGRSKRKIPTVLSPGIEEAVALREAWSHKQGTPETLEHASRTRQGALARLYQSGAIDAEQLAAGVAIREAAHRCTADVLIRTVSLETRVDVTRRGDGTFYEALGAVWSEVAYSRWRSRLAAPIGAVLDMIVGDVAFTVVARRHGMHNRRAKKLLVDALDLWPRIHAEVRKEIDAGTLAAAHAGIL